MCVKMMCQNVAFLNFIKLYKPYKLYRDQTEKV